MGFVWTASLAYLASSRKMRDPVSINQVDSAPGMLPTVNTIHTHARTHAPLASNIPTYT